MERQNRIAIVTGGNRGIGFEIAKQLSEAGFRVIAGARTKTKGAAAAREAGAEFLQLDVADEKSIRAFAKAVKAEYGAVHVLVNNAGILEKADSDILSADLKLINETLATNAIGPLLLTQALLPLMPAGARVINVSSGGGSMTDPVGGWAPVYCASKSLLNALTRQLAHALESRSISVNAMCPGWVRTDMGGRNAPRSVQQGADTAVWLATAPRVPSGKFFRDRKEIPF